VFATSSPEQPARPMSAANTSRRRSKASASAPPTRPIVRMGMTSMRLNRPTMSEEWLSR